MCKHNWAPLLVRKNNKIVSVPVLKVCLDCGELKVGTHTIRISKNRIDMDGKPIRNVSRIDVSERLKLPVGTNLFD